MDAADSSSNKAVGRADGVQYLHRYPPHHPVAIGKLSLSPQLPPSPLFAHLTVSQRMHYEMRPPRKSYLDALVAFGPVGG